MSANSKKKCEQKIVITLTKGEGLELEIDFEPHMREEVYNQMTREEKELQEYAALVAELLIGTIKGHPIFDCCL